jgi:uncharacterized protein
VGLLRAALLTLLWLALLPATGRAAEPVSLPALNARVTDLTATLDATQRGRLEAQLAAIDRAGKAQVAVLLLPTTQPETIEQFGIRLAEAWKVGRKGADNGLIIIVAKNDRKMRIEVGYGLEGPVPDAIAKRIIAERMAPAFKQGDFFGGLRAAVEGLEQALGGTLAGAPEQPSQPSPRNSTPSGHDFPVWGFALVIGAVVLHAILGLIGSVLAVGIAGWLGFKLFGTWLAAASAAFLVFLFSMMLFLMRSLSKLSWTAGGGQWSSSSPSGGDFPSMGGGGFSSGGGSDFSGGGGSFGGGGSSGSW